MFYLFFSQKVFEYFFTAWWWPHRVHSARNLKGTSRGILCFFAGRRPPVSVHHCTVILLVLLLPCVSNSIEILSEYGYTGRSVFPQPIIYFRVPYFILLPLRLPVDFFDRLVWIYRLSIQLGWKNVWSCRLILYFHSFLVHWSLSGSDRSHRRHILKHTMIDRLGRQWCGILYSW